MNIDPRNLKIDDYNYRLPEERIALHPAAVRDKCMLLVRRPDGSLEDHTFDDIVDIIPAKTLLVCNNTRVINARLRFHKAPTAPGDGALIEVFCLEPESPRDYDRSFASTGGCTWTAFVGNSKKWKSGPLEMTVRIDDRDITLSAERVERRGNASVVRFTWSDDTIPFARIIDAAGEIPIPPYLNRPTEESDATDYQTVFSHIDGSVAAPTAGLHFTPELLKRLDEAGVERAEVTLHVGAGTFKPVTTDTVGEHPMHSEWISVSRATIERLLDSQGPVIAIGTTAVRTLESLYQLGVMALRQESLDEVPQWYPYTSPSDVSRDEALRSLIDLMDRTGQDRIIAQTRIIIAPGYDYKVIDGMVTNFHQPCSTLLLLVSAFIGGDDWRRVYDHALSDSRYRFLSYGDACIFLKSSDK